MLDYHRALAGRYQEMTVEERVRLCELVLYEACRRFAEGSNEAGRAKYSMIIELCETIENEEGVTGFFNDTRLFPVGLLRLERVLEPGYDNSPAYQWLKSNGGRLGRYEMQTVITDNAVHVYEAVSRIQDDWRRNRFGLNLAAEAASQSQSDAGANTQGDSMVPVSQNSTVSTVPEDTQMQA